MPAVQQAASGQWHPGEDEMHRLLGVPNMDNPTMPGLPMAYGRWMSQAPLLALGAIDDQGRVWTTVLGGAIGVATPIARGTLAIKSTTHLWPGSSATRPGVSIDPVLQALLGRTPDQTERASQEKETGQPKDSSLLTVDHGPAGKLVSGLAIDFEQRTRVKIAGRVFRGVVKTTASGIGPGSPESPLPAQTGLAVTVDETLGNCPKYINRRLITPHEAAPRLQHERLPLSEESVNLIGTADTFFISSRHGGRSMDTNHRGGEPGFVRILSNSAQDGVVLVYPEYSGNRLLQTLGNIASDPAVGVTFPNFETGDVLYTTGRAEVLLGSEAASLLPHSNVAVRITVDAARFVHDALTFRGSSLDRSPYNPPARRLALELTAAHPDHARQSNREGRPSSVGTATLIGAERLTPTISRYRFQMLADGSSKSQAGSANWQPGQHVTLDFSAHLDRGWAHMRDHDPRSLNDDYIRSFTITGGPAPGLMNDVEKSAHGGEFEITVRTKGAVTGLLSSWAPRTRLEVPVLGFGGEGSPGSAGAANLAEATVTSVAIAGGVGITHFMTWTGSRTHRLRILWSLRSEDLPLALDFLKGHKPSRLGMTLFVTGPANARREATVRELRESGVDIHERRIEQNDVLGASVRAAREFTVCASPSLTTSILHWIQGEPLTVASFQY